MNIHFIKIILRKALRNKAITYINLIGLTVGITVIILLVNIIRDELSVDQYHKKLKDIYCILTKDQHSGNNSIGWNESVPALPRAMMAEMPEVLEAVLVENGANNLLVSIGEKNYNEDIQFASPNLFKVFSFPLVHGAVPDLGNSGKIIALSKTLANKFYGNANPVGQIIKIDNKYDFQVVAVFDDIPLNSSLRFDCWAPIDFLSELYQTENYIETWENQSFQSYVLLNKDASAESVNSKLKGRIIKSNPESTAESQLYPFSDIYTNLYGHNRTIRVIGLIGLIIFILISINFINLKTVDAFHRIKEFGIRKISGAGKGFLFTQLVAESAVVIVISGFLAFILAYFGFSLLNNYLGNTGSPSDIFSTESMVVVLSISCFIAFSSASLPSISLMASTPITALKSKVNETIGISRFRNILTGSQFGLAVGLIICTLFAVKQLKFMKDKNLGFNKEQLLYINLQGPLQNNYKMLKNELARNPNILKISAASRIPTGIYWNGSGWDWEGRQAEVDPSVTYIETDKDFSVTFDLKIAEGGYFNTQKTGVVINRKFARIIAPDGNALNKKLSRDGQDIEVVGIVEDFHFKPLNSEIGPLMFIHELGLDNMKYLFMKISPNNMEETLSFIEQTVKSNNPGFLYSFRFLDDDFASMYKSEELLKRQLSLFSTLAIIISAMGLWGILLFMVQRRIKEIGIRKINGAKTHQIVVMLNKDLLKWISIAFIIACPIAWYAMNKWLENFAYKTELSWWIFASAGCIALFIALATVSWQSWKAATRNPVEALRSE